MIPAIYNLPTGYKGDTYGPINFYVTNATGAAINLNSAAIDLHVKHKINNCIVLKWSTSDNTIFVSGNKITLSPVSGERMNMLADNYKYDFQVMTGSYKSTYLRGDLPIIDETTEV
jgi:hypothetical protein